MADKWVVSELQDGRWGVYKNGICHHVARTAEDARFWFRVHAKTDDRANQDKMLGRAIGKSH